jgi:hypothetical protein
MAIQHGWHLPVAPSPPKYEQTSIARAAKNLLNLSLMANQLFQAAVAGPGGGVAWLSVSTSAPIAGFFPVTLSAKM